MRFARWRADGLALNGRNDLFLDGAASVREWPTVVDPDR